MSLAQKNVTVNPPEAGETSGVLLTSVKPVCGVAD